RVVRVRVRRVLRERIRRPREREGRAELRSAEAATDQPQPEHAEQVERNRREMDGRQRVPLAAPAKEEVAGEVRLECHRTVRVPLRVGGFAATVRLNTVADLPSGV